MEEAAFDDLHQAAVAGAEGTAWGMPEFASCPPLPPVSCYSAFSDTTPFDSFSTDPAAHHVDITSAISIPVKEEPVYLDFDTIPSSPTQPSLCSIASEESFAHAKVGLQPKRPPRLAKKEKNVKLPASPVSTITKPRTSARSSSARKPQVPKAPPPDSDLSKHDLTDLKGTTAARSRKMTEEERRIMLHKRRLRNRASAARSREKRSRTLVDLTSEVEELMKKAARLAQQASGAVEEARQLRAKNALLVKENELLKSELRI